MLNDARAVGVVITGELPRLLAILLGHSREGVHARRREPHEERLPFRVSLIHKLCPFRDEFQINGFHTLSRERSGVDDPLLAHHAEAGVNRLIFRFGRIGVHHPSRPVTLLELRVARVIFVFRFFLGVQVVQVAEELVEPVNRGQVFVPVTQVVLAELACRVALRLQDFGDGGVVRLHAHRPPDHADRRQARPDRIHARNEGGTPSGARRMRVVVSEHCSFFPNPINVRGAIAHDSATVNAEVRRADIVAPDHHDVRLLAGDLGRCGDCQIVSGHSGTGVGQLNRVGQRRRAVEFRIATRQCDSLNLGRRIGDDVTHRPSGLGSLGNS